MVGGRKGNQGNGDGEGEVYLAIYGPLKVDVGNWKQRHYIYIHASKNFR